MGAPKNTSESLCPDCSNSVVAADKFCRNCGVGLVWSVETKEKKSALANKVSEQFADVTGVNEPSLSETQESDKEGSWVAVIGIFTVAALIIILIFASASSSSTAEDIQSSTSSNQSSRQSNMLDERIGPHIVTGYAWNDFKLSSGIQGNGTIADFSRELYQYLERINPVTKSGLEISMSPGSGLSSLLYSIIDDEGVVEQIYSWLYQNAPN